MEITVCNNRASDWNPRHIMASNHFKIGRDSLLVPLVTCPILLLRHDKAQGQELIAKMRHLVILSGRQCAAVSMEHDVRCVMNMGRTPYWR